MKQTIKHKLLYVSLILFGFFFVLPNFSKVLATNYYVATSGNDSSGCSGGTESNPWRSWSKAEQCVESGDTVYFKAGTYTNIFSGSSNRTIKFNGATSRPVTIMPALGAEGKVYFNRSYLTIKGSHGVIKGINMSGQDVHSSVVIPKNTKDILLENNKIHHSGNYDCVHIHRNADKIVLINNEIYDCNYPRNVNSNQGDGIDTTGGENLTFRGNRIYNAKDGIQVKAGAANILIEKNIIHDVGRAVWGSSVGHLDTSTPHGNSKMHDPDVGINDRYHAKNITIRNNLIYNTDGWTDITISGWRDYRVYNNTIYNHGNSWLFGISSSGWDFFDSTALDFCNNSSNSSRCSNCSGLSSNVCQRIQLRSKNGEIKNNIVHIFNGVLRLESSSSFGLVMSNNLYYDSNLSSSSPGKYQRGGTNYSFSGFRNLGYEQNSLIANPGLVSANPSNSGFLHLTGNSPAIDTGVWLSSVTDDYEGKSRPQGLGYDIGAFEYGGVVPTSGPTSPPTPSPTSGPTPTSALSPSPISTITNTPSPSSSPSPSLPSFLHDPTHSYPANGYSVKITNPQDIYTPRWETADYLYLDPIKGNEYMYSLFTRTESIVGTGAKVIFTFYDGAYQEIGTIESNSLTGTNDWTKLTQPSIIIPNGSIYAKISLVLNGIGRVWFDSIEFGSIGELNTIAVSPNTQTVTHIDPDTPVSLDINILRITDLFGFQMNISYDPTILEYVSLSQGTFLGDSSSVFWIAGNTDTPGIITNIAASRYTPGIGVTGSSSSTNPLFTLNFKTLTIEGTSDILIQQSILVDKDKNSIPPSISDGKVIVSLVGPTPTPTPTLIPGVTATPTPSPILTPTKIVTGPTPTPTLTSIPGTPISSPSPSSSDTPIPSLQPSPSSSPTLTPIPSPISCIEVRDTKQDHCKKDRVKECTKLLIFKSCNYCDNTVYQWMRYVNTNNNNTNINNNNTNNDNEWNNGRCPLSDKVVGDFNNDGKISTTDLSIMFSNWGSSPTNLTPDMNNDGKVTVTDLSILLFNWVLGMV